MNNMVIYNRLNELTKRCLGGLEGDLADLVTTNKTNLIAAINEIKVITNLLLSSGSSPWLESESYTEEQQNQDLQPTVLETWTSDLKTNYIQRVSFSYDTIGRPLIIIVEEFDGSGADANSSNLVRSMNMTYDYTGPKETKTVTWA